MLSERRGTVVSEPSLPSRALRVFSPLLGYANERDYSVAAKRSATVALADNEISLAEDLCIGIAVASYHRDSRSVEPCDEHLGPRAGRSARLKAGSEPEIIILSSPEKAGSAIIICGSSVIGGSSLFTGSDGPANALWHIRGQADFIVNFRRFQDGYITYSPISGSFAGGPGSVVPVSITFSAHAVPAPSGAMVRVPDSALGRTYSSELNVILIS